MPEAPLPDEEPDGATFRVRCPSCGPQVVELVELRLVEARAGNRYMFPCPECGERVRRPAGPELSEILRTSGVTTLALHRGSGTPES
jgi:endogenous inhibitor of DNA gyrase (YacG/DUF329 family)